MRIIQFDHPSLGRSVGILRGRQVCPITEQNPAITSVVAAFHIACRGAQGLERMLVDLSANVSERRMLDYRELLESGLVLPPVTEDAGARILVSGTGLTHLGSVQQRDQMHQTVQTAEPKSNSREMFEMGLAGGRPAPGERGVAPEWFYKGDGRTLRGPGQPLVIPSFAPDGGEEPEVVGIYIIDDQGTPRRLGFAQGNEWSDHVTESVNYLYLAPSKLQTSAIGPELVTDFPFDNVRGRCRARRGEQVLYDSGELLTGEQNMCHSLANLEDHHFKFPQHRIPGDIHVHFFGTSKLSFQHRAWQYQDGDVIEVSFDGLGAPLTNPVQRVQPSKAPIAVRSA